MQATSPGWPCSGTVSGDRTWPGTCSLAAVAAEPAMAKRRAGAKVEWGLPHRGRISPEEATWVREHLDEVQALRADGGVPLLDPADSRTKERYGPLPGVLQNGVG